MSSESSFSLNELSVLESPKAKPTETRGSLQTHEYDEEPDDDYSYTEPQYAFTATNGYGYEDVADYAHPSYVNAYDDGSSRRTPSVAYDGTEWPPSYA